MRRIRRGESNTVVFKDIVLCETTNPKYIRLPVTLTDTYMLLDRARERTRPRPQAMDGWMFVPRRIVWVGFRVLPPGSQGWLYSQYMSSSRIPASSIPLPIMQHHRTIYK